MRERRQRERERETGNDRVRWGDREIDRNRTGRREREREMFFPVLPLLTVFSLGGRKESKMASPRAVGETGRWREPTVLCARLLSSPRAVTCLKNVRTVNITIMDCQMSSLWSREIQRQNRSDLTVCRFSWPFPSSCHRHGDQ